MAKKVKERNKKEAGEEKMGGKGGGKEKKNVGEKKVHGGSKVLCGFVMEGNEGGKKLGKEKFLYLVVGKGR